MGSSGAIAAPVPLELEPGLVNWSIFVWAWALLSFPISAGFKARRRATPRGQDGDPLARRQHEQPRARGVRQPRCGSLALGMSTGESPGGIRIPRRSSRFRTVWAQPPGGPPRERQPPARETGPDPTTPGPTSTQATGPSRPRTQPGSGGGSVPRRQGPRSRPPESRRGRSQAGRCSGFLPGASDPGLSIQSRLRDASGVPSGLANQARPLAPNSGKVSKSRASPGGGPHSKGARSQGNPRTRPLHRMNGPGTGLSREPEECWSPSSAHQIEPAAPQARLSGPPMVGFPCASGPEIRCSGSGCGPLGPDTPSGFQCCCRAGLV